MGLMFDVQDYKKIRVIIDTDAACEADDPYAIAHALMSPKLIVRGIVAEHFNEKGSVQRSYDEIVTILKAMKKDVPVLMGEEGPLKFNDQRAFTKNVEPADHETVTKSEAAAEHNESEASERTCAAKDTRCVSGEYVNVIDNCITRETSEGANFIIEEALKDDSHPLFVLCQGAITNVAAAIRKCPDIIGRMTVVWIGTHGDKVEEPPFREFNAGNDIDAANFVLGSGTDIWLVPSKVYVTVTVGLAELQKKVYGCGEIGRHLFENMVKYNMSEFAGWTQGESWSLGDSPAVAVTINPGCGHFHYASAPIIGTETQTLAYLPEYVSEAEALVPEEEAKSEFGCESGSREVIRKERPIIRIYDDVDTRYILEDFFAKLELNYGKK